MRIGPLGVRELWLLHDPAGSGAPRAEFLALRRGTTPHRLSSSGVLRGLTPDDIREAVADMRLSVTRDERTEVVARIVRRRQRASRTMLERLWARLGLDSTRRFSGACLLLALAATTIANVPAAAEQAPAAGRVSLAAALHAEAAPFFAEHCIVCHGNRLSTVNLNLERLAAGLGPQTVSSGPDASGGADDPQIDTWTRVLGKLNAGQMPPPGRPRPADDALARLTVSIEAYLADGEYRRTSDPGRCGAPSTTRTSFPGTPNTRSASGRRTTATAGGNSSLAG